MRLSTDSPPAAGGARDAQTPERLSDGVSERWGDNLFLKMSKRYPNRIHPSMIRGKMHAGRFCCELTALKKR
jgi:hypothetical protein